MNKTYFGVKSTSDEQVVVLSSVLACDATMGYESTTGVRDSAVAAFNGTPVQNLAQLARLVMACQEGFMRFDLEAANKVVVVDAAQAHRCTAVIRDEHNIAADMSKDVQEQLDAWAAEEGGGAGQRGKRVSVEALRGKGAAADGMGAGGGGPPGLATPEKACVNYNQRPPERWDKGPASESTREPTKFLELAESEGQGGGVMLVLRARSVRRVARGAASSVDEAPRFERD
ncbi:hypothetical protein CHLNCDRAFT_56559 [Chlorella variabilis]|uniref:Protease Do-like PDZ domain-containing protein n=1 Tax=Chlorella variabilis TaxID=554065 RepID=E1Z337_CHLVA|nr:hypothetical protein CHLNCDRAFT_56559 [Chlorella variabilis]EFN59770.1 hypothetical protein CHLNCDRAFT_56559 [Chlorella variabilis]|eukprot:XP_005851872.1 hypothetical protein CHLNCDRAFT_56559 [Chlorella variabilis]